MSSERKPEISEVIRRHLDGRQRQIRTSRPAKVVRFDAQHQLVDCKPLVQEARTAEDGTRVAESLPVVPCCLLLLPGAAGFRLTVPISDGTLVIPGVNNGNAIPATTGDLFYFECSVDKWSTGTGAEVDPEIDHRHAMTDAVFVPQLNPSGAPWASWPTDHMTLGPDAGPQLHFRPTFMAAGDEAANDWVALATATKNTLARLQAVLNALFKATATPINEPGNGAPSALQIALIAALTGANITDTTPGSATWPDSVAATQLKAK